MLGCMFGEQPANQPNQPIVVHMVMDDQPIDWLLADWFDLTEPVLEALEVCCKWSVSFTLTFSVNEMNNKEMPFGSS